MTFGFKTIGLRLLVLQTIGLTTISLMDFWFYRLFVLSEKVDTVFDFF